MQYLRLPLTLICFSGNGGPLAFDARYLRQVTMTKDCRIQAAQVEGGGFLVRHSCRLMPGMDVGHQETNNRPVLIMEVNKFYVAVLVDRINGLVTLPAEKIVVFEESDIDPSSLLHGRFESDHGPALIIDVERLFSPLLPSYSL